MSEQNTNPTGPESTEEKKLELFKLLEMLKNLFKKFKSKKGYDLAERVEELENTITANMDKLDDRDYDALTTVVSKTLTGVLNLAKTNENLNNDSVLSKNLSDIKDSENILIKDIVSENLSEGIFKLLINTNPEYQKLYGDGKFENLDNKEQHEILKKFDEKFNKSANLKFMTNDADSQYITEFEGNYYTIQTSLYNKDVFPFKKNKEKITLPGLKIDTQQLTDKELISCLQNPDEYKAINITDIPLSKENNSIQAALINDICEKKNIVSETKKEVKDKLLEAHIQYYDLILNDDERSAIDKINAFNLKYSLEPITDNNNTIFFYQNELRIKNLKTGEMIGIARQEDSIQLKTYKDTNNIYADSEKGIVRGEWTADGEKIKGYLQFRNENDTSLYRNNIAIEYQKLCGISEEQQASLFTHDLVEKSKVSSDSMHNVERLKNCLSQVAAQKAMNFQCSMSTKGEYTSLILTNNKTQDKCIFYFNEQGQAVSMDYNQSKMTKDMYNSDKDIYSNIYVFPSGVTSKEYANELQNNEVFGEMWDIVNESFQLYKEETRKRIKERNDHRNPYTKSKKTTAYKKHEDSQQTSSENSKKQDPLDR